MDYEKRISFLNRYFIFQKIATRNVEKLTKSILEQLPDEIEFEDKQTAIAQKVVEKVDKELKPKVKKLKKKLLLQGQDVELNIEEETKAEKAVAVEPAAVEPVEPVAPVAVEPVAPVPVEKKKVKKTRKLEGIEELKEGTKEEKEAKKEEKEKKKTTRKKKVLIGDIEEV